MGRTSSTCGPPRPQALARAAENLGAENLVRVQQQEGEERALLAGADAAVTVLNLKRS